MFNAGSQKIVYLCEDISVLKMVVIHVLTMKKRRILLDSGLFGLFIGLDVPRLTEQTATKKKIKKPSLEM